MAEDDKVTNLAIQITELLQKRKQDIESGQVNPEGQTSAKDLVEKALAGEKLSDEERNLIRNNAFIRLLIQSIDSKRN